MSDIILSQGQYLGAKQKSFENNLFTLSITDHESLQTTDKHYHENSYLSILLNGCYFEKNNTSQNPVLAGDILLRPSGYLHQNNFHKSGGRCFNIEFKPDWATAFDKRLSLSGKFTHFKAGAFPSLYKLLFHFQTGFSNELTQELLHNWLFETNRIKVVKGHLPWLEKVTVILENELDKVHSLNDLAQRVFVHPVYLSRAFKERRGITVGEYQLQVKLKAAIQLLFNTNLPVNEIAAQTGFYDDSHFINVFRSVYKCTPQQFRISVKG